MVEKRVQKLFVEELEKRIAPASFARVSAFFAHKLDKVEDASPEKLAKMHAKAHDRIEHIMDKLASGKGNSELLQAKLAGWNSIEQAIHDKLGDGKEDPYGDGRTDPPLLSSLTEGEDAGTGR